VSADTLLQAIACIKAGDKRTGQALLSQIIQADPKNEAAWLWLASIIDEVDKKRQCLERVLAINPNNKPAKDALARLSEMELPSVDVIVPSQPKRRAAETAAPGDVPLVPTAGIAIEFSYSSSQSFEFALQAAQGFPTFRQFGEGKKARYQVTIQKPEIAKCLELVSLLKGWRNRMVYVDGQKAQWDAIFAFAGCYESRMASYRPQWYCYGFDKDYLLNFFGCVQANMPFRDRTEWLCWGKWQDKKGDWEFDKQRMRHQLESELYPVRFCPALNQALVERALAALPESVNPNKDKNWEFVESYNNDAPGLTMTVNRYGMNQEVVMMGVGPRGYGALIDIWKSINRQLPAVKGYIPGVTK